IVVLSDGPSPRLHQASCGCGRPLGRWLAASLRNLTVDGGQDPPLAGRLPASCCGVLEDGLGSLPFVGPARAGILMASDFVEEGLACSVAVGMSDWPGRSRPASQRRALRQVPCG